MDVQRVPAAHVMIWEPGEAFNSFRYWTPLDATAPRIADEQYVGQLRDTLDRVISNQATSEGKQGIFLSGGVDSTYLASSLIRLGANPISSFTSMFEECHGQNETEYASAVARWLGINFGCANITVDNALESLRNVVLSAVEPCAAWATITTYSLLELAKGQGILNLMSGLGADEVFGGYDHFRSAYVKYLKLLSHKRVPAGCSSFNSILLNESPRYRRVLFPGVSRMFSDSKLAAALNEPYRRWRFSGQHREFYRECLKIKPESEPMEMMVAHECQHRIPDLLFSNFEPLARRMGVEFSYPFLDPDVVKLATGLAVESRYRTTQGQFSVHLRELQPQFKHAMLMLARDRVPDEILNRSRKSLTAPFGGWMTVPKFADEVYGRIRRSKFWDFGLVRRDWLQNIRARLMPEPGPPAFELWAILTLASWYDRYVESPKD
jgi:asparagine synthetase B (glutamine-hydrolysing)